jgi:hypothetical protein
MIIEPEDGQSAKKVAEDAVWATFKWRLEQTGNLEGVPQLRRIIRAKLVQSADAGRYTRRRFDLYQRVSDYSTTYNAVSGEQLSWLFDLLRNDSEPGLDAAACLRVSEAVANPPAGAVLDMAEFEEQGDATVFVARWMHLHDGVPVEGDFIQVAVNPSKGQAFAHHRKWHKVDPQPSVR